MVKTKYTASPHTLKLFKQKPFCQPFLCISTYFDCSIIKIVTFLLQYIFLKSINIGPLILHFFKITNHPSIFSRKYQFKSLFDWHRPIDYRFALSICPPLWITYIYINIRYMIYTFIPYITYIYIILY